MIRWKPHWLFGRWNMKFLEQDPNKMIWKKGVIKIYGRTGLQEEKPELAAFLSKMFFTDAQLSDLMLQIEESDEDTEVVARRWMEANPDVINAWLM